MKKKFRLLVLILFSICFVSCGGSGGSDNPEPQVQRFTLSVNTTGQGNVAVSPEGGIYTSGTMVSLTANPSDSWNFEQWTGAASGSQNPLSIVINNNTAISAVFSQSPDNTPPNPDPMTWTVAPSLATNTSIAMTATTATDSNGVEYYFRETTGNPGADDSGWQPSNSYLDSGLMANTQYTYELKARDRSSNLNETGFSTALSVITPVANAGIVKTGERTMRLAGTYTFNAVASTAGGIINWTVDRDVRSEASGGDWIRTSDLESGSGSSFTLQLNKLVDQETVYHIKAEDNGFNDSISVQVFPANQTVRFNYTSAGNPQIPVYIRVPASLSNDTHLLSIHHGTNRTADTYITRFDEWAIQNDYIAIAPLFSRSDWPGSRSYNLGNLFTGNDGEGSLRPESQWSFTLARDIVIKVLAEFALDDTDYDAWGHSAGGQFVHRMLIFRPDAPIRYSMPANPGWWTAPDLNIDYPYGLKHPDLDFTQNDVLAWTERDMIIYRGTEDTDRSSSLRQTPEADAQGLNRFERAAYMYNKGQEQNSSSLNWTLNDVPGVGHSSSGMAPPARSFLQNNPND